MKPDGGWGFNALTPSDADSILWALRLAVAVGAADDAVARGGHAMLARHRGTEGGIATYADAAGPRGYVGLPATVDFSGWTMPHVCVSAAAAGLHDVLSHDWLIGQQAADGHWPSYWWFDPGYATAEAVEAIGPGAARDRARGSAERQIDKLLAGRAPSSFGLAHAVRILGAASPMRAIDAVAGLQKDDGSWPASARLRVPAPGCATPQDDDPWTPWRGLTAKPSSIAQVIAMTFTITSLDHRRCFTTATVLRALTALAA